MTISQLVRDHLLARLADQSPWLLSDVQFALKKDAVEESLEAFGLSTWFSELLHAHRGEIEAALQRASTGVLVSSGRHRLALLPFSLKGAEVDWTPDPPEPDGWIHVAGRYDPPRDLVAPPAPAVALLSPVTVRPALEEPQRISLLHPWERVAVKTSVHRFLRVRYAHLTPEERSELPVGEAAFPQAPSLEAARLDVDRAIAHTVANGRTGPEENRLLRAFLREHREAIARAILEGPKVVVAGPGQGEILEPAIPFPERPERYSPEGLAALTGEVATVQGLLDLVREVGKPELPIRIAYFTYPGDPLVPEVARRIREAYPESALPRYLEIHGKIVKKPSLILEYEDGRAMIYAVQARVGVKGLERQLYIRPRQRA